MPRLLHHISVRYRYPRLRRAKLRVFSKVKVFIS